MVLNHDGTIKDIVSVKQKVKRGKKTVEIPIIMQVPEMVTRANNIASSFLCENAKYLFGIDEKMSLRTLECFKAAKKKHLDMIVANNLKEQGAGFGTDTNRVTIISEKEEKNLELMSKEEVADEILNYILEMK